MLNRFIFIGLFVLLSLFSCKKMRRYDIGVFSIVLPESWKVTNKEGIDSSVGIIITSNNDTIKWDYGYYSDKLKESLVIFSDSLLYEESKNLEDTSIRYYLSDDPDNDYRNRRFHKEMNKYIIIDDRPAKIVYPKVAGDGRTGTYIYLNDELRLSVSGENLDYNIQKELLKALNTIIVYDKW